MTPLMGNVQSRPIRRHREWVPGGQGRGGEGLWVVIAKVREGHFWGDGKFPEQGTGMATRLGELF